jgi:FMN phosphatase YigB (HAD superfamily)
LLIPFIRKRSAASAGLIEELYQRCSLGEFPSAVFWEKVGLPPTVEDEHLGSHSLVNGVKEFVAEAKGHFDSVCCLSNDVSEWSAKLRQRFALDDVFDGFVISGDVHSRKPSPEIYKALLAASNSHPHDVLFIDDRPKNVLAAIDQGIGSILFGR